MKMKRRDGNYNNKKSKRNDWKRQLSQRNSPHLNYYILFGPIETIKTAL